MNDELLAKRWARAFDHLVDELSMLLLCGAWASRMLNKLTEGEAVEHVPDFPAGNDSNFQEVGRRLDLAIHQLNVILPEPSPGGGQ